MNSSFVVLHQETKDLASHCFQNAAITAYMFCHERSGNGDENMERKEVEVVLMVWSCRKWPRIGGKWKMNGWGSWELEGRWLEALLYKSAE